MIHKGIAFKIFLFTAALIALAVIVSLGILCFILPDYYLRSKTAAIQKQADLLAHALSASRTEEDCASLIKDFAAANNAVVLALKGGEMLPLSSPFLSLGPPSQMRVFFKTAAASGETDAILERFENIRIAGSGAAGFSEADDQIAGPRFMTSIQQQMILDKPIQNSLMDRVRIVCTMQPVGEATQVIISLTPYLLILDLLIALPAAYFYARRLTKPILRLSAVASQMRQMAPGAAGATGAAGIYSRDELGDLSRSLDLLYQSLCANIETLRQEKETVNQLEQAKTDFMRAASHELKTPIAALNGILEGMIDGIGVYKDRNKYLLECKNLISRLTGLVNEILNAAAMDAVEEKFSRDPVDIDILLSNALEEHRVLAEGKNLRVALDLLPCQVNTDEVIFYHTIINLVSNAVKYTPAGGLIQISLNPEVLSIENECEPIPPDQISKLFEPFFTLSYSRDKKRSGTGLGLYIVKRNLERLHMTYSMKNSDLGLQFNIFFHYALPKHL
ncbi:MAG: HAMP domain-containing histidine kinase [Clostridiales bacterium]|jgi:two-component system sensor kinase Ihk|nr:HAMP domain-containing histidine kinase [Clostridiales bacterium]